MTYKSYAFLSRAELEQFVTVEPETGTITFRHPYGKRPAGAVVGVDCGYRANREPMCTINGYNLPTKLVVWYWVNDAPLPENMFLKRRKLTLDEKGVYSNTSIENLRLREKGDWAIKRRRLRAQKRREKREARQKTVVNP